MPAKKKTKSKSKKKTKKAPAGLDAALKKAEKSPKSAKAWDELEKLAAEHQSPDGVAKLYRKVMSKDIAKRALQFHEEWCGDDPDAMSAALGRILDIDPDATWAFERLCVELTQAGMWDQLFGAYDRELGRDMDVERRKKLLDDAAQAAKDFADEPERALGYMSKMLELDPGNARLSASLERLYERLGNWDEVIAVWRGQIPTAGKKAAGIRVRIASAYLEKLGDHGKALEELRVLVDISPGHEGALELLEKLLGDEGAPKDARMGALGLLRTCYDGLKRDEDAIRVIEKGLTFVERGDVLRKELARRLVALGKSDRAMEHYETLLVQRPDDVEARTSLVSLAGSSGSSEVLARAQVAAGEGTEGALRASLLSGAAEVYRESEADKAIDLYLQVLETQDAEVSVKLAAARTLDDLLAQADRKKERLAVLQKLVGMEQSSSTRRTVLGEVALLADEMGETQAALEAWRSRIEADEKDIEALDALIEGSEEDEELVKVLRLRAAAKVPPQQRREDLVRMASVQEKLGGDSIETLLGVVKEFGYDAATIEALDASLAGAKRWSELVEMLDGASGEAHGRAARLMERLGEVHLKELGEPKKALAYFTAAAVEDPKSEAALGGLRALIDVQDCAFEAGEALARAYESSDDWKAFIELVDPLVSAAGEPEAKAKILIRAAKVHEEKAGDAEIALRCIARAFVLTPHDLWLEKTMRRLAGKCGEWKVVNDALGKAAEGLADSPARAAQLLCMAGKILESEEWDESGSLQLFERAMKLDRRIVEMDSEVAPLMAKMQKPGPALVATLLRMAEHNPGSLDTQCEASEVALEHGDVELARTTLERLYQRGSRMLVGGEKAQGEKAAEPTTAWALEKLVQISKDAGDSEAAAALLVDGAGLPLESDKLKQFRLEAADLLMERGDVNRAMSLFHENLEQEPGDRKTLRKAAELCEKQGRITELMALRLLELDMLDDVEPRLELRLDISNLAAKLEHRGGRVESLLENLEERPGHGPSIEGIVEVLTSRGQLERLADIIAVQAEKVGEDEGAARLWTHVARLAEMQGATQRAIDANMRVVDLEATSEALDALARLHAGEGRSDVAAGWLEKRLELASKKELVPTLLRLGRAHIEAKRHDRAVNALEKAFEKAPKNDEVRRLLVDVHRAAREWEPLVHVMTTAAGNVKDEDTILEYANEVHEICTTRLDAPEKAVGILERAIELSAGNGELKTKLADALVAAGRLDDAGKIIEEMIAEFGRRRSPERAALHLSLARVSQARGDTDAALENLETASKMDISNASILKALADLAREKGNLDRAEHAYRSLLVNLRHREGEAGPVGPAEIQMELSRIADERGQKDKAAELRESAIESLARDDSQASSLQKNLREHGEVNLLRRALETRLDHVTVPGRRARIHAQLSSLLERDLGDTDEAFDAILLAVETDPVFPLHHEAAQEQARKLSSFDRYIESLEGLLAKTRRGSDAYVRCELLLRLGEVTQHHLQDQDRAADLYKQAEETGVREVDVWRAQVALATETGDKKEKKRLLDLLSAVGEDNADARASALYSIAEVHFMAEDALDEGLETLKGAMEEEPHYDRAGKILERASEMHGDDPRFLEQWEVIARRSEDASVLLGYLGRQASAPDATQEQIREAAELALTLEKYDRAESLMLRAVESGDETGWAPLALASRRVQSGDLEAAVKWLSEATPLADPDRVLEVGKKIARVATGPQGDPDLAAKVYESLRASHPAARDVWEPLASIYTQLGDIDRLVHLVDGTLDSLEDISDRSSLRLMLAGALMGTVKARDAIDVLRDILDEQPENLTAQTMLMEHLEKTGQTEDLSELIESKLASAFEERDAEAVKVLSMRLAKLRPPEQAVETYRKALEIAPDDAEIVEALLSALPEDHDPADRAGLMEKILAGKHGDDAAEYSLELAEIHHYLGSNERVMAVLETGFRASPSNVQILKRLEQLYGAKGQHDALASRLLEAARHRDDKKAKVDLLMRAAALYREELSNPSAAASALDEALGVSPGEPRVVLELASAAREAGQILKAIEKLSDLLETGAGDWRTETLVMRSELYTSAQDPEAAVEDLEEAFKLDATIAPVLEKALINLSDAISDVDAERKVMTRLVELRASQDVRPAARELLASWVKKHDDDLVVLRQLRDFDTQDGNWDGVAETCETLTDASDGKAKIDAVLDLVHAYERLGRSKEARKRLETVYAANQDSRDVRNALKDLYETLDLKEQLANMIQAEAEASGSEDEKVVLLRQAADLLVAAGKAGQGVEVLESLAKLRPDDIHVVSSLSDALADRYEHARAGEIIDAFLEKFKGRKTPEYSLLLLRRSKIAGEAKDYEAQLTHIEQAFKFNRRHGEIVAETANVAEKMGNFELALQALRNVHLTTGQCPITVVDGLLRQARLMMMNGDSKGALLCARKALKEDPDSDEAANLIADLM